MAMTDLELSADELRALDDASARSAVAQDRRALGQHRDLGGARTSCSEPARARRRARLSVRSAPASTTLPVRRPATTARGAMSTTSAKASTRVAAWRRAARPGGASMRFMRCTPPARRTRRTSCWYSTVVRWAGTTGPEKASVTTTSALRAGCRPSSSRPSPSRTRSPGSARRSSTVASASQDGGVALVGLGVRAGARGGEVARQHAPAGADVHRAQRRVRAPAEVQHVGDPAHVGEVEVGGVGAVDDRRLQAVHEHPRRPPSAATTRTEGPPVRAFRRRSAALGHG